MQIEVNGGIRRPIILPITQFFGLLLGLTKCLLSVESGGKIETADIRRYTQIANNYFPFLFICGKKESFCFQ
ncbi:hypothetical protein DRQ33_08215 [bacterium]|nr:MAG: hypothetical protein DRQ33_08215 [bacterium]